MLQIVAPTCARAEDLAAWRKGHRLLLDFRYEDAREYGSKVADPALSNYLQCTALLEEALLTTAPGVRAPQLQAMEAACERIEATPASPFRAFALCETLLQRALLEGRGESEVTALRHFRGAYLDASDAYKKYPTYRPLHRTYAILGLAASQVPEGQQWLASIAGVKADEASSLKLLQAFVANTDTAYQFLLPEPAMVLAFYRLFLKEDKAGALSAITRVRAQGKVGAYAFAVVAAFAGKSREGLAALATVDAVQGQVAAKMLAAGMHLNLLQLSRATAIYKDVAASDAAKGFKQEAIAKLAETAALSNDLAGYRAYLAKYRAMEGKNEDIEWVPSGAEGSEPLPNLMLLRARLLCDAGSYGEARSEIARATTAQMPTSKDKSEWQYRMGRIWQLEGADMDKALKYYKQCAALTGAGSQHRPAYSLYYMGVINIGMGAPFEARTLFAQAANVCEGPYCDALAERIKRRLKDLK